MKLFPAIDLFEGSAVRLVKGDYDRMTIYSSDPPFKAREFYNSGCEYLHVVDLEGAKSGETPNFETVKNLINESNLKVQIGGGIRSRSTILKYLDAGAHRVILGTAAAGSPDFVHNMVEEFGGKIAVGVDVRDGFVAVKGWTELSEHRVFDFCRLMEEIGVETIICTDISKDGLLAGTNLDLYRELSEQLSLDIIASGGVSSLGDISALFEIGLYGCILGKAIYTGNIDLKEAVLITSKEGK